ncbi:MAG: hypothetical protein AAGI34_11220 [Pseudomonadota bacterium]
MTQMPAFDTRDTAADPEAALNSAADTITLKRTGLRPLSFEGTELCMAMSFTPQSPYWYEINIFRTTGQDFVAAVKLFFQSEHQRDVVHAWECQSFDEVLEVLEDYDAGNDIPIEVFPDTPGLSIGEMAAHAFTLHARVESARQHYAGLIGEILDELQKPA